MISVSEAEMLLLDNVPVIGTESVPLELSVGRILREDLYADRDMPPFDRVAMDGIALVNPESAPPPQAWSVSGVLRAGVAPFSLPDPAQCVEVMTGAVLPQGCDEVVPYESLEIKQETARLLPDAKLSRWNNIHRRATDIKIGGLLIKAGVTINPTHVAVAAATGKATLEVSRVPRIVIISTGDELVDIASAPLDYQIRDSNGPSLAAALMLQGFGNVSIQRCRDDAEKLRRAFEEAFSTAEMTIICGGVSRGAFDHVPDIVSGLGSRLLFDSVSQRPGKPIHAWIKQNRRLVFGLPGNPVASLCCLYRYVIPCLLCAAGTNRNAQRRVILRETVEWSKPLTLFRPFAFIGGEHTGEVKPVAIGGSADFAALTATDGFVEIGPGPVTVNAGTRLNAFTWGQHV